MDFILDADQELRRPPRRDVTRMPTTPMTHAQFHVGAASWTNPWELTGDGKLFRWIIARYDVLRGSIEFFEGNARAVRPELLVVADIVRIVGTDHALTWVGVSANRLALYRQLEAANLPATCGGEHNVALESALVRVQERTTEAMRRMKLSSWPKLPRRRRDNVGVTSTLHQQLWEPRVARPALSPAVPVIACDGSLDSVIGIGAYAAVSSAGAMCAATTMVTCSGEIELHAIIAGLELGVESGSSSFALITDSLDAIERLERLLHGRHKRGEAAFHERLSSMRHQLSSDVVVHHDRGRTGDRLHDAADAIAFAVRRGATNPRETVAEQLEGIVDEWVSIVRAMPRHDVPDRSMKRIVVSPL